MDPSIAGHHEKRAAIKDAIFEDKETTLYCYQAIWLSDADNIPIAHLPHLPIDGILTKL